MNRSRLPRLIDAALLASSLLATPLLAQVAPASSQTTTTTTTTAPIPVEHTAAATPAVAPEAPLVLSPFTVDSSRDQGYFAGNTLAGTRLNTFVGDLPSSITVVTKQQLEDTGSLNINDVFRYEANTEGARTYTPTSLVRTEILDTLSGTGGQTGVFQDSSSGGNRIRGLSAADNEKDNFFSLNRIPFDDYNTQSVEIDRGPNSLIFGTGSPSGIVNQSRAQAVLNKFQGQISISGASWGTFRQTVSFNIPLIQDKLAIYLAQLYNDQGFQQKPSTQQTRRQYAAFTLVPFKSGKTRFTGSYENFNQFDNLPNGITPQDDITPWIASGRPIMNPLTQMVTYLSSGKTSGPYVLSTTDPNFVPGGPSSVSGQGGNTALTTATSPFFVPGMTYFSSGHNIMFVNQGSIEVFERPQPFASGGVTGFVPASFTASQALASEQRLTQSAALPTPALYTVWHQPGVVNKDIYDWSTINVNSINETYTKAQIYHLDFQQQVLDNLAINVAWYREELAQTNDGGLGQVNATQIFVDTNSFRLDGTPNPHVGQPFVDTYSTDVYVEPEKNNNYRASIVYSPDLTKLRNGFLNKLGHHQFLVSFSQHDDVSDNLRYRPAIDAGDPNYLPSAATLAQSAGYSYANSNAAIEQVIYLGGSASNASGHASTSPGQWAHPNYGGPTTVNITTYNYAQGAYTQAPVHMDSLLFYAGAGTGRTENLQDQKTYMWQSYLWQDRIVGTLGINDDEVKNRNTIFPTTGIPAEYVNGFAIPNLWKHLSPWSYIGGNTSSTGVVFKPFQHWARIDGAADGGNVLAAMARTIGLTFNRADNFNPPAQNYTDFFGKPLGKPQGKEKDWGFTIATPDNKLFLRTTWFQTTNENQVTNFISTARADYLDVTQIKDWASAVVEIRNGENPSDPNFGNAAVAGHGITTVALQNQVAALTGLPYTYGGNVGETGEFVNKTGTQSAKSKGIDLELTYNPLPNWTMKITAGKQVTTVSDVAQQGAAWIAHRMPYWLTVSANDLQPTYTTSTGTILSLRNFWTAFGYDANARAGDASGNTSTQSYFQNVVAGPLAVDQATNGTQAANQHEWSGNFLTSYTIASGPLQHLFFGGNMNYQSNAVVGYYGSTTNTQLNTTTHIAQIAAPDTSKPIYTPAQYHFDAWIGYGFKLPFSDRIRAKIQFNVADLTSSGKLLPILYNFDGSPATYRIIPPRQYTVKTTFNF